MNLIPTFQVLWRTSMKKLTFPIAKNITKSETISQKLLRILRISLNPELQHSHPESIFYLTPLLAGFAL